MTLANGQAIYLYIYIYIGVERDEDRKTGIHTDTYAYNVVPGMKDAIFDEISLRKKNLVQK